MMTLEAEKAHIEDRGLRELSKRLICECLKDAMNYSKGRVGSTEFVSNGAANRAKYSTEEAKAKRRARRLAKIKERVELWVEDAFFKGICISYGLRPEACKAEIIGVLNGKDHEKIRKLIKQVRAYKSGESHVTH